MQFCNVTKRVQFIHDYTEVLNPIYYINVKVFIADSALNFTHKKNKQIAQHIKNKQKTNSAKCATRSTHNLTKNNKPSLPDR